MVIEDFDISILLYLIISFKLQSTGLIFGTIRLIVLNLYKCGYIKKKTNKCENFISKDLMLTLYTQYFPRALLKKITGILLGWDSNP